MGGHLGHETGALAANTDRRKPKHSDKIVFQCQFVYHKTDINFSAIDPDFPP